MARTAYRKEDCDQDPGWCFKAAVGRALPKQFFSYGQTLKTALSTSDIASLFPDSRLPPAAGLVAKIKSVAEPLWPKSHKRELPVYLSGFHPFDVFYHLVVLGRKRNEPPVTTSSTDTVASKGHSDGLMTAKIFALMGSSKLGFVDQYVNDSITALGPDVVDANSHQAYRDAFLQGLAEGESNVKTLFHA
jgi:glucan 1,3-beta-glucosidase